MIRGAGLFSSGNLTGLILLLAAITMITSCDADLKEDPAYYRKLVADRRAPDLSALVKRATNDPRDKSVMDSFYDILYLRENPDPNALPILIDIFNHYRNIHGHIMKYAVAQAIYTSGAPGSGPFLTKNLISHDYSAIYGISFAFHHSMKREQRHRFIELYHLVSISADLGLTTEIKDSSSDSYIFRINFKNRGNNNIKLNKAFGGARFYFKSQKAYSKFYYIPIKYIDFEPKFKKNFIIKPGEVHIAEFPVKKGNISAYRKRHYGISHESDMVLEIGGFFFPLKKGEKYQVYAMFELMKSDFERNPNQQFKDIWTGRAVSEPVLFTP